jgi:transglutaminase-like putative cysteine protease
LRFEITHRTSYRYEAPVFLAPHLLRLRPASDSSQKLESHSLVSDPAPAGRSDNLDLDGNDVTVVWFNETTDHLDVETTSVVETLRPNPFDYLWTGPPSLPLRYADNLLQALQPYRQVETPMSVRNIALAAAGEAGNDPQAFLARLAGAIKDACHQIRRDEGEPWPPDETLAHGEGSCRDVAVLYMAAARSQGFAARFVSGYHAVDAVDEHDLHAWAEVYVPGGGWRSYDATTGFAVADAHVAIARGATPRQATPVSGTYRGRAASHLTSFVSISALD